MRPIGFTTCILLLTVAAARGSLAAQVELWRLDCGTMDIDDISYFSDSYDYDGESAIIPNGCYLVRNGDSYLLWDAGLARSYLGNTERRGGWLSYLGVTVDEQLEQLGLSVADIEFLGISHFHGDHVGQAVEFENATLLMNERDIGFVRGSIHGNAIKRLAPWIVGERKIVSLSGDHDVFGDGSVTILSLPGHTPGHSGLLIRLENAGDVLLSGDLYHFNSELNTRIVSLWNSSRAETLASMERFELMIENLDPIVVVQHDPNDVSKLPEFPASLD